SLTTSGGTLTDCTSMTSNDGVQPVSLTAGRANVVPNPGAWQCPAFAVMVDGSAHVPVDGPQEHSGQVGVAGGASPLDQGTVLAGQFRITGATPTRNGGYQSPGPNGMHCPAHTGADASSTITPASAVGGGGQSAKSWQLSPRSVLRHAPTSGAALPA